MGVNIAGVTQKMSRTVAESVYDNAVVTKELRTRMRGTKPYLLMGGYVLLLGIVLAMVYLDSAHTQLMSGQFNPLSAADQAIGMGMFTALTITQVVLLTLVLPSLTAGSITHELERQTIDLLALTRLTAGKVVLGKHLSGFLYGMVLMVCSLPLAGLCLLFGGISPAEVGVTYALTATWAFMVTAASVMWSSLFKRTAVASLLSYAACFAYMTITAAIGGAIFEAMRFTSPGYHVHSMASRYSAPTGSVFSVVNPGYAPVMGMLSADVGGVRVPVALITAVLQVAIGVLMLLVASTHVRFQRANRPLSIRLLLIGVSAALVWMSASSVTFMSSMASPQATDWFGVWATVVLTALCLCIPMFATGTIRKRPNSTVVAYSLSIRKLFTNDLGGAIGFAAFWAAILFAALGGALALAWPIGHRPLDHTFWAAFWHVSVAGVAIVAGITALGVLLSSMCPRRRNAVALLVLTVIVLFLGYSIMLIGYDRNGGDSPVWQLAALWPMTPIICAMDEWKGGYPTLSYADDAWLVTTVVYLLIGFVALCAAGTCHENGMGVREEE